jgi:beta-galactosidase
MPDWTHPGCEGKIFPVWCYTNAEEAELFLNGISYGVRKFSETSDLHLSWDVPYRPGTLEVRAKMRDGTCVCARRITAGKVASYRITRDFEVDGLVFFRIDAVDENSVRVISCEDELKVFVHNGSLLAIDNASPVDHSPFGTSVKPLCRGSMLVIVRGGADAEVRVNRIRRK